MVPLLVVFKQENMAFFPVAVFIGMECCGNESQVKFQFAYHFPGFGHTSVMDDVMGGFRMFPFVWFDRQGDGTEFTDIPIGKVFPFGGLEGDVARRRSRFTAEGGCADQGKQQAA